jgi:hypothetical protein
VETLGEAEAKALYAKFKSLKKELRLTKDEQRALLREALGQAGSGKVAHHIIPLEAITKYKSLLEKAAEGGFDINGVNNGILLNATEHIGGHPLYNGVVLQELGKIPKNLSPAETAQRLQDVADALRKAIEAGKYGPWGALTPNGPGTMLLA